MKNIINKIKNIINNWLGTEEVLRKYIDEIHRVTHSYIYDYKKIPSKILFKIVIRTSFRALNHWNKVWWNKNYSH